MVTGVTGSDARGPVWVGKGRSAIRAPWERCAIAVEAGSDSRGCYRMASKPACLRRCWRALNLFRAYAVSPSKAPTHQVGWGRIRVGLFSHLMEVRMSIELVVNGTDAT